MQKVYGYVRVSTTKQGDGVSLEAQQESIQAFAQTNNLLITKWFEEKQTAAKIGRIKFNEMLDNLSSKKAQGVIFHKIDRSTRNHSDWSKLIDLRDFGGISFYFSGDGIDMNSRSGRFIADINVAMAKHYIDNLREEVLKGLYGRLKQGIYPFKAVVGYLDKGGGKLKEIDPIKAPVIKEVFRLVAEESYTIEMVRKYLWDNGLKSSTGKMYGKGTTGRILHNPFYMGIMKVKGKTFQGKHQPIISAKTFQKVQDVLGGKLTPAKCKNDFLYRKLINCKCSRKLIGERQKGLIYYRCHNKECSETTIREDRINQIIESKFKNLKLNDAILELLKSILWKRLSDKNKIKEEEKSSSKLRLSNANARLNKLTDLLLDELINKEQYLEKEEQILKEISFLKESQEKLPFNKYIEKLEEILELSKSLYWLYNMGNKDRKRSLLKKTCSNLFLNAGKLTIETKSPFSILAFEPCVPFGGHERVAGWDKDGKISQNENFWWIDREMKKWEWLKSEKMEKIRIDTMVFGLIEYITNH